MTERRSPPRDTKVTAVAVGTSATAATAVVGAPSASGPPAGSYTFEARVGDIYVVFGPTAALANPTATANGFMIKAGTFVTWELTADDKYLKALASVGSSFLLYQRNAGS